MLEYYLEVFTHNVNLLPHLNLNHAIPVMEDTHSIKIQPF